MQMRLVFWMVVMMVMLTSSTITVISNVSLENCTRTCGNVSVPYPFGFGHPKCAINSSFLLQCNQSGLFFSGGGLFLGGGNVIQIDNISLEDGTITPYIPAAASDCYNDSKEVYSNYYFLMLDGWPLTISPTRNKLIALGCDALVTMSDPEGRFGSGCLSICHDRADIRNDDSCSGFGCCQTSVPKHLNRLNVTVRSFSNYQDVWHFNPCSYAFVVANSFNIWEINFLGPRRTIPPLPVVFEWAVGDQRGCQDICSLNALTRTPVVDFAVRAGQGSLEIPISHKDVRVNTPPDVDECKEPHKYPCPGTCLNTIGSYTCENKTNKTSWPIILGKTLILRLL
ncbi:hypothetical protein SLEP1_g16969 [Rubroshorea leprosula]|uniref:Wall-associated receptor kinase galacturonan-binding domain-containing protein n=1 Tax=Rubroshorea leprosula TaxID=152421 RepID=A0AAV5J1Q6_9ROSI|nr:hypothetical protein SLEP1_g16969 [Rubroshorea leprosula]